MLSKVINYKSIDDMFDFVNHFLTSVINYREVDRDICLLMNENYLCSKRYTLEELFNVN